MMLLRLGDKHSRYIQVGARGYLRSSYAGQKFNVIL